MQVEATMIGQPKNSVDADCDLKGFYIEMQNETSSIRIYLDGDHIDKLAEVFVQWGFIKE